MRLKKNMKLGNRINFTLLLCLFCFNYSFSENRITSTPLLNVDEIKPSFEDLSEEKVITSSNRNLKEKNG